MRLLRFYASSSPTRGTFAYSIRSFSTFGTRSKPTPLLLFASSRMK